MPPSDGSLTLQSYFEVSELDTRPEVGESGFVPKGQPVMAYKPLLYINFHGELK